MLTDGPAGRAVAAVLLVVAWVLTWRPALDPDLWWHLELGDRIVATGAIPTIEPWSWWSAGRPILAHSWAWDVGLATVHGWAGLLGVSLVGVVLGGLAVALAWWLVRLTTPTVAAPIQALIVVVAAASAVVFWSPRAQLVDIAAVLALTGLFVDYARTGRARRLVALPLIALLWANLHGSAAPAGLLAVLVVGSAGLLLGERLGTCPDRPKRPLVLAGLAAVVALLVNPAGPALLAYPLDATVASAFTRAITEWAPPDLSAPGLLIFRLTLAAAVIALALPARRSGDPIVLLMAAAWTVLALGSARFVLIAGPLLVLAIGPVFASLLPRRAATGESGLDARGLAVIRMASALAIVAILVVGTTLIAPATQTRLQAAAFPVDVTARLEAADCRGRLLHAYDWGGYLIRHTDREVSAYGNSPGDIVGTQADLEAVRVDPRPFLETQDVALALLKADSPLAAWFRSAAGWRVALDDDQALLAVRGDQLDCQIR